MTDHKHRITFEQAKAAHARGVVVWTPTVRGDKWFSVNMQPWPLDWDYYLDRTPGRALTYDEACVHNDCGLDCEVFNSHSCWELATPTTRYARSSVCKYRVPFTEAKEPAVQEQYEYVTGARNVPEGTESEWQARMGSPVWYEYPSWSEWRHCVTHDSSAQFRRLKAEGENRGPAELSYEVVAMPSLYLLPPTRDVPDWGKLVGKRVSVTVREILPNAPHELNWKAERERLTGERDAAQAALVQERTKNAKLLTQLDDCRGSLAHIVASANRAYERTGK